MASKAIVDRFEGDFVILENESGLMIQILQQNAPAMLGEGMIVEYENDKILSIDHEATNEREEEMRRRFERLLIKND